MRRGVLRAWRLVILAGIPVTLAGVAGALASPPAAAPLLAVSLVGWAVLPAPALWHTGRESTGTARTVNRIAAVLSLAGVGTYLAALAVRTAPSASPRIAGLALVGVGQTVGIVDAAVRY
jgi:hypothetical protein